MGKRRPNTRSMSSFPKSEPVAAFNSPFAQLSDLRKDLPEATKVPDVDPDEQLRPPVAGLGECEKIVVQAERKGRAGKTVTRVKHLPASQIADLARRLKADLGCGATCEEGDLLVLGSLVDRVAAWLESRGARRVVVSGGTKKPRAASSSRQATSATSHPVGGTVLRDGTRRGDVGPGMTVDIVLKEHQRLGTLTRGVVKEVLTRSATHPHGIKVRLADGRVGRVKRVVVGVEP